MTQMYEQQGEVALLYSWCQVFLRIHIQLN